MPSSIAAVQAALDRARQLGLPVTPPVLPVGGRPVEAASPTAGTPAGSLPGSPSGTPAAPGAFEAIIQAAAAREGIDPGLVRAVARAESNFDAGAVSPAGAKGVMQLMDATARSLGVRNAFDPAQNIAGGTRYLKQMLDRYGGDVKRALAAYNAGPGAVDQHGGIPPYAETQSYVQRVLSLRSKG